MGGQFHVNACVKLKPSAKNTLNICEIPAIIRGEFAKKLDSLYKEVLFVCVKELNTSKLTLESIKVMPTAQGIKITANVLLSGPNGKSERTEQYKKVEFTEPLKKVKELDLHRFIKYMEIKVQADAGKNFEALMYIRIIPFEKDDISPEKF